MAYERVKKNRYYDPTIGYTYPHSSKEHYDDLEELHLPLERMHNAHLHDWGIAAGLEVSGTVAGTEVVVDPGVAVDGTGRLIALAPNGRANLGTPANPTETIVPVHVGLGGQPGQTLYLTIQFAEVLRTNDGSGGRLEQVPWLRLQPTAGSGAYVPDGTAIILAIVVLSPTGQLAEVKAADGALAHRRRLVGQGVGELRVRRAQTTGTRVEQAEAGWLGPREGGGLEVRAARLQLRGQQADFGLAFVNEANTVGKRGYRLAFDNDRLTFQRADDAGDFAANQVAILPDTGNVGIGTTAPTRARLEVAGKVGATTALLGQGDTGVSFTAAWPGIGFNSYVAAAGNWRGMAPGYTGVIHLDPGSGAFRVFTGAQASAADQPVTIAERLTLTNDGNLGIGTSAPQARLHIANGDLRLDGAHTIAAGGRLHVTGDETLFLLNRNGVVVSRAWGGTGDLTVEGHIKGDLTVDGRVGVNGQSPVPRTPGWGGGIHTWDIEAEGTAWCRWGWQTGSRDLAENYLSEDALEPGEVVCFDPHRDGVARSTKPDDLLVCGVISTRPGVLLNADRGVEEEQIFPVALCGRVPCRAVAENGPIRRGDLLTSSSTPGHAMKARPVRVDGKDIYQSGTILGKALESLEAGTGIIEIFVAPG
jgi:hypothetical protein